MRSKAVIAVSAAMLGVTFAVPAQGAPAGQQLHRCPIANHGHGYGYTKLTSLKVGGGASCSYGAFAATPQGHPGWSCHSVRLDHTAAAFDERVTCRMKIANPPVVQWSYHERYGDHPAATLAAVATGVHPGSPALECSSSVGSPPGRGIVPIYIKTSPTTMGALVVTFIDGKHANLRFSTKRQACLWVKTQMKGAGWTRTTARPYVIGWNCVAPPGPDITCTRRGATIIWQYA